MITLKNWYQQQPEVVYFVQTDYQGEKTAYNRFIKCCNVCKNKDK